jgi:hypothetical protein
VEDVEGQLRQSASTTAKGSGRAAPQRTRRATSNQSAATCSMSKSPAALSCSLQQRGCTEQRREVGSATIPSGGAECLQLRPLQRNEGKSSEAPRPWSSGRTSTLRTQTRDPLSTCACSSGQTRPRRRLHRRSMRQRLSQRGPRPPRPRPPLVRSPLHTPPPPPPRPRHHPLSRQYSRRTRRSRTLGWPRRSRGRFLLGQRHLRLELRAAPAHGRQLLPVPHPQQ